MGAHQEVRSLRVQTMAEEGGNWDYTVDEWLISEGYCVGGGLAQKEDGAFYAAAPAAGEAGWGIVFADDHEESIMQDDGVTEKKMMVNEATGLKTAVDTGKAPACGLWLGGLKYTISRYEKDFESGDHTFTCVFVNRPKKGVHIVATGASIVAGFYDEEKGQTSGNAKKAVIAFAEYLAGIGY